MAILVSCTCLAVTTIDPVAPYAYGANVGWINLSMLATLSINLGPSADGDNIPVAWELGHTNTNRFYRVRAEPPLSP